MKPADEVLYGSDGVVRRSRGTHCGESKVRPEFQEETDINRIVHRMTKGQMPGMIEAQYLDVSAFSGGLQEALNQVNHAEEVFAALAPQVRQRFKDALAFTRAFETEEGVAELKRLGVIGPTEEELADRREAAAEDRARRRADRRAEEARVEAARKPPVAEPKS